MFIGKVLMYVVNYVNITRSSMYGFELVSRTWRLILAQVCVTDIWFFFF